MRLEELKDERLKSLENAYRQQMKVLDGELNIDEVDPEKMNTALKAYKTAADESEHILEKIIEMKLEQGLLFTVAEKGKENSKALSPEQRNRR